MARIRKHIPWWDNGRLRLVSNATSNELGNCRSLESMMLKPWRSALGNVLWAPLRQQMQTKVGCEQHGLDSRYGWLPIGRDCCIAQPAGNNGVVDVRIAVAQCHFAVAVKRPAQTAVPVVCCPPPSHHDWSWFKTEVAHHSGLIIKAVNQSFAGLRREV